jgi:hypothetical protein
MVIRIVIGRSLWAGVFARIGRASSNFFWRTFVWKTQMLECILVMSIGCITENVRHNSTAQTVHNFVVNLEYSARKLLGLLSATMCACISTDSFLPTEDSHHSREFLNGMNHYQLFREDLVIMSWLCVLFVSL